MFIFKRKYLLQEQGVCSFMPLVFLQRSLFCLETVWHPLEYAQTPRQLMEGLRAKQKTQGTEKTRMYLRV